MLASIGTVVNYSFLLSQKMPGQKRLSQKIFD
jgi:hypothetical protein